MTENHEHEHEFEEEVEYVFIPDEEGNEERFEVIYKFEVDETGKKYMLLVPADESESEEEEQEVLAFRYEEDGEEGFTLYTIESDEEWDMVEEAFNTFVELEDVE
jgi:uncharacterized protein YrzB (UPF0473 family)